MATSAYRECGLLLQWGEIPNDVEWLLIIPIGPTSLDDLIRIVNGIASGQYES